MNIRWQVSVGFVGRVILSDTKQRIFAGNLFGLFESGFQQVAKARFERTNVIAFGPKNSGNGQYPTATGAVTIHRFVFGQQFLLTGSQPIFANDAQRQQFCILQVPISPFGFFPHVQQYSLVVIHSLVH